MERRRESSLAQQLAELTRDVTVRNTGDPASALHELVGSATDYVPGAQYVGITLAARGGSVESVAATHRYAELLDEIQEKFQEGPCLSAAWNQQTIEVPDLSKDSRWPKYRREATASTPVRSILSYQLFTGAKKVGALNFYADNPGAFEPRDVELGLVFATHVAITWNMVLLDKQMRSALASRDIIGQAKGIIMERFDVDAVRAFELLKRLSQDSNVPLVTVAERLVTADHPSR
ncbi:GAF and ANTAR domain-containing protein [Mycolicibacterium litorale]|nr:GAF and ANTAR domain-containing protein [Mycolicibacterium litorale]MCV7418441.1 GAF and ANTAR domain-containing protein [Mycolicibacterium litorale]